LATRSLQTEQTGVEVTGQNLANINNPAYSRQRVQIETSVSLPSPAGPEGTGADVLSIQQLRSDLVDGQIRAETSVGGYWQSQQTALQYAEAGLGEILDRNADNVNSAAASGGVARGLSDELSGLFNAFQNVATSPSSLTERLTLMNQAQSLATRFNQISTNLTNARTALNSSLDTDVTAANKLLTDIASLNDQVANTEMHGGVANDLRDLRESKLEQLAKLTDIQTSSAPDGSVNVTIGGQQLINGKNVVDTLQTFDAGGGQMMVRTTTGAVPLTLTGGTMQGTIDARDGALQTMRTDLDTLASTVITQVNNLHQNGFSLTGSTGAAFFTGTDAATIGANAALVNDPSLVQAAGVAGATGDNSVALALAQLAQQPNGALNNQTFNGAYGKIVADLGNALQNANDQIANHDAVDKTFMQLRDSVSGVSMDEEVSNLMIYQHAYQASARLVTTIDTMLDTVVNMKSTP
jgi:flagellar hook-associated protein 1 FlgK